MQSWMTGWRSESIYLPNLHVYERSLTGENVQEDTLPTSCYGNKAVGLWMVTLCYLDAYHINIHGPLAHEALWTRTQKVLQPNLSGAVLSLPRAQLLTVLPVFPSLLPTGDPLEIQNTPSLEEYYLLQIGAKLHMVWKELTSPLPVWPMPLCMVPLNSTLVTGGICVPHRGKSSRPHLTCKPLSFQCQDQYSV